MEVRNIDWEVNLVLSSKSVGVLDESLVNVHLSNIRGETVSLELTRDDLELMISKVTEAKTQMQKLNENEEIKN